MPASAMKRVQKNMAKARTRDSLGAFAKLTGMVDGRVRIVSNPPLIVPLDELMPGVAAEELRNQLHEWFRGYRRTLQPDRRQVLETFELVTSPARSSGWGASARGRGSPCCSGATATTPCSCRSRRPRRPCSRRTPGKTRYANHGRRVVEGQRLMQSASDIFLGWDRATGVDGIARDFYVRQLWDGKMSADVDSMGPEMLGIYAEMCGSTLARAHARSGDRVAIASYLGANDTFDRAVAEFASAYADQNERDYEAVLAAAKAGVIEVDPDEASR